MLAELLAHEGVEEELRLASRFGVMAFHGGSLEVGTDQIAAAVADRTGASLYAVRQPPDLRWHIPSTAVRPEESARLRAFSDHVHTVLTVHGYGRDGLWTTILVGGGNRELAAVVAAALSVEVAPHGYDVVDDLGSIPRALRGQHPDNPANRPPGGGVQLELPPRIRGNTPLSRPEHTAALIAGLTTAILHPNVEGFLSL